MSIRRIVLILPCCIGDVVLATATLMALRRAYPQAHITWAVGSWSRAVVENHDLLDALLDTGPHALPVKSLSGFMRFVQQLRAGRYDLAVSLVRSPLMSAAVLLSGIPKRAGLDSAGRGFGYNIRAPVNPREPRHEAQIYLDVVRALGKDAEGCVANVPVQGEDVAVVKAALAQAGVQRRFIVLNPAGGRNPGMIMDSKRWPPQNVAALGERLAARYGAQMVLVAGPDDGALVEAVQAHLQQPCVAFVGRFTFGQIVALADLAWLYIGNDTGLTHLAAASDARTIMIFGPSDPVRYAPFTTNSLALRKPAPVDARGVAGGAQKGWDWARDGISVDDAENQIAAFVEDLMSG